MHLDNIPFQVTDWSAVAVTEHPGDSGVARWRTVEVGNVRVRRVEYTAGYVANHWCERGHVLLVLQGELVTELRDGRSFTLKAGDSYEVADGAAPHRSRTAGGASQFIVD
jgi:quercetin dioxygenase-like cupin family protein